MIEIAAPTLFAALASGALVGFFLAVFGGGGSVLAAPLLLYVVGVTDPHIAIGTSSAAVAANAAVNLIGHWRGGRVKWPCAIVFALAGLVGAFVGARAALAIDGDSLLLAFAFAMAAIGLSMLRAPASAGDPDVRITAALMARLAPLGLLTGFAAGFFGIGGGFLIVPGLMLAAGMTIGNATASSLVSVALFGATTSLNYAAAGLVLAKRLAARGLGLRRAFAAMVILVAAYVAARALGVL